MCHTSHDEAMDVIAHASEWLDLNSFVSDAYHDASRILRTAYGAIGTPRIIKTRTQANGRVIVETH